MTTIRSFLHDLPNKVAPEAISDAKTLFHFDISGDQGGLYTLEIDNGEIKISEGLIGESKCTIKASDHVFSSLVNKETNPMTALMMGKLKVSNPGEIMKYIKILGLM
jgi:putative sterol carrier protein